MEVLIKRGVSDSLWLDGVEADTLPNGSRIVLELDQDDQVAEVQIPLERALRASEELLGASQMWLELEDGTRHPFKLEKDSITGVVLTHTISWDKHYPQSRSGRSDPRVYNDFMPKWSTAYKNPRSSHSRMVEPILSTILDVEQAFESKLVEGDLAGTPERVAEAQDLVYGIEPVFSLDDLKYLKDTIYKPFVDKVISFGRLYHTIYVNHLGVFEAPYEIIVYGEYKEQFIECRQLIESDGVYTLPKEFSKIYRIEMSGLNLDRLEPSLTHLRVANFRSLEGFSYEARENTTLRLTEGCIELRDEWDKVIETFNIPDLNYQFFYVDKNDHITAMSQDVLYTGKLDAKWDLDIPHDTTYNNNPFIEACRMEPEEYSVELFLQDYQDYSSSDLVAVSIKDGNRIRYLDLGLDLVVSDEPIFINRGLINTYPKLTLDLKLDGNEYFIVSLEDYNKKVIVSNLIVVPKVDLRIQGMPDISYMFENTSVDAFSDYEVLGVVLADGYKHLVYDVESHHIAKAVISIDKANSYDYPFLAQGNPTSTSLGTLQGNFP